MKKYAPPFTVTNCGKPVARRQAGSAAGRVKLSVRCGRLAHRGRGKRLPIAEQRILFAGQAGELGAGEPRALHKLELAGDVGVEADELKAGLGVGRRGDRAPPARSIFVPYSRPRRRMRWKRAEAIASSSWRR